MDLPIGLGDRVDAQQAVFAALVAQARVAAEKPLTGNSPIDHEQYAYEVTPR